MDGGASLFSLSIDLELGIEQQTKTCRERLDVVLPTLLGALDRSQIPATWAVADPAISAAAETILASPLGHELAVLADSAWCGTGAGRLRMRRELSRRFDRARKAGMPLVTLALHNVDSLSDIDLFVEQGIQVIRGNSVEQLPTQSASFSRADIWHVPAALRMPTTSTWWLPQNWAIKRHLRLKMRRQTAIHLAIDAQQLVAADDNALSGMLHLIKWLADAKQLGRIEAATLGAWGKKHLQQHIATPSRSLLRAA